MQFTKSDMVDKRVHNTMKEKCLGMLYVIKKKTKENTDEMLE